MLCTAIQYLMNALASWLSFSLQKSQSFCCLTMDALQASPSLNCWEFKKNSKDDRDSEFEKKSNKRGFFLFFAFSWWSQIDLTLANFLSAPLTSTGRPIEHMYSQKVILQFFLVFTNDLISGDKNNCPVCLSRPGQVTAPCLKGPNLLQL